MTWTLLPVAVTPFGLFRLRVYAWVAFRYSIYQFLGLIVEKSYSMKLSPSCLIYPGSLEFLKPSFVVTYMQGENIIFNVQTNSLHGHSVIRCSDMDTTQAKFKRCLDLKFTQIGHPGRFDTTYRPDDMIETTGVDIVLSALSAHFEHSHKLTIIV